jgi:glycosyltransferase involved in cell wall biosynthesis
VKQKLIFFTSSLFTFDRGRGGIAELLYQLVPNMTAKYDVEVIALFGENETYAPFEATIIQNKYSHRPELNLFHKARFWMITSFFLIKYIVDNFNNIKKAKIVSTSPGPSFILPLFFKNIFIWENVSFFAKRKFLDYLRLFVCYMRNAMLIVPTRQEYESLKKRSMVPSVKYLPDWFDPSIKPKHRIKNGKKIKFMSAGMLEQRKGFDLLLEAIKLIPVEKRSMFEFTIFGDGDQRAKLQSSIIYLGIEDCVSLMGFVPNLNNHYDSFDAFILSSRYEGFPLVMVNALASGMPVIAFDCETGPRDIIVSGYNGILVESGDVAEMSRAIMSFSATLNEMNYYKNCISSSSSYSVKNSLLCLDEILTS